MGETAPTSPPQYSTRSGDTVADREAVLGSASVALSEREVDDVAELASKEGYRAEAIAKALGRDVKLAAKTELKRPSS